MHVQYTNYPYRHASTYPVIPIIDVMKHNSVQSPPFRHLAYVHILQHRWCANDAQPMTKRMASRPYAIQKNTIKVIEFGISVEMFAGTVHGLVHGCRRTTRRGPDGAEMCATCDYIRVVSSLERDI
jgi:hypothetical protein